MSAEPETLPAEPESLPAEPETLPAESETLPAEPNDPASKQRWRLRLSIDGSASWLSQLDLLAVMEKAIRRAALPIAFSQGFNPHMLISWGPAHAVGLSGDSEYTDLLFTMPLPANWHVKLNKQLPVGLKVISATLVPENTKALTAILNRADYSLELLGDIDSPHIDQAISNLIVSASYIIERQSPKGHKNVNIRPALLSLTREGHTLLYSCALNVGPIIKPQELIAAVAPGCHQGACRRKLLHSNN
ncbi:MAG: TIGR03936 family radical SAM-associated protein [Clostridiales bacterium]|nr:TIGR03936 family radical SAM-associated protein [Clostridiales bacterium]